MLAHLYDHLSDTLATEGLAADKGLALDAREEVAEAGERQHHRRGDEAGRAGEQRQPLGQGHGAVRGGAHVVGRDAADGGIEGARGRADSQQQGHLNEEDDERRDAVRWFGH